MTTISNQLPNSINWMEKAQNHLLPIYIKTATGALLTWSRPQDVAIAFVAQKCVQTLGIEGISLLNKKLALNQDHIFPLALANIGISFFAGHQIAQKMGYNPSLLAMGIGAVANTAINIYRLVQLINAEFKEEDFPNVISVTAQNFQEEVEKSKLPVVLDAYAPWCPPCNKVAPIFAKLAEEMEAQVKFVKVNVDKEPELVEKLNIKAMPTFLFFKDGKEIHRKEGAVQREYFVDQIELMQKPGA